MKATSLGPAGLAIAAVLALCVLTPPEVYGLGLAAVAALIALAGIATSGTAARSPASRLLLTLLPLMLLEWRMAIAPGEAVEPVACLLLATAAGISASACGVPAARLAWLYVALVAVASGTAIYQALWGLAETAARLHESSPGGIDPAVLNRLQQGRPYAGFVTPAALGGFLAMTIPAIGAWALGKRGVMRTAGLVSASAGVAGLIATRSVGALAALGGATALAALRGRVTPRLLAVVAAGVVLAIIGAGIVRPDAVFAPTHADSPWRLRAGNVRIALEIARDHPLVGVGPGGYAEAYPQYRRDGDNESRYAHDLPAQLVAEWGVPAGLALSLLFFCAFLSPVVFGVDDAPTLGAGLGVGLASFALHNLVDFTAFLPSLLVFAAISRGLLAKPATAPVPAAVWERAVFVVFVVSTGALAAASGISREALFAARLAAASGEHAQALRQAERAEAFTPWAADPPAIAAGAALALTPSALARASVEAERAVAFAPARASARSLRARVRAESGDGPGAYADLLEASRLYPMQGDYAAQAKGLGDTLRSGGAARR